VNAFSVISCLKATYADEVVAIRIVPPAAYLPEGMAGLLAKLSAQPNTNNLRRSNSYKVDPESSAPPAHTYNAQGSHESKHGPKHASGDICNTARLVTSEECGHADHRCVSGAVSAIAMACRHMLNIRHINLATVYGYTIVDSNDLRRHNVVGNDDNAVNVIAAVHQALDTSLATVLRHARSSKKSSHSDEALQHGSRSSGPQARHYSEKSAARKYLRKNAAAIVVRVLSGLAYLHRTGLAHGNLCASTIQLTYHHSKHGLSTNETTVLLTDWWNSHSLQHKYVAAIPCPFSRMPLPEQSSKTRKKKRKKQMPTTQASANITTKIEQSHLKGSTGNVDASSIVPSKGRVIGPIRLSSRALQRIAAAQVKDVQDFGRLMKHMRSWLTTKHNKPDTCNLEAQSAAVDELTEAFLQCTGPSTDWLDAMETRLRRILGCGLPLAESISSPQ